MRALVKACFIILAAEGQVSAQEYTPTGSNWPVDYFDPGHTSGPADLVLPMPCGGAMAFQRVAVPLDIDDPMDDRRIRLGQTVEQSGYSDYLREAFLRGSFTDTENRNSYYFISRYELTTGQFAALRQDCAPPERQDRIAKGDLSWFEAVELSRDYSSWLLKNAREMLPAAGDAKAFVRLPTEAEWEYAARGGSWVDPIEFAQPVFFGEGQLKDYAIHQSGSSSRGALGPVGLREASALGLFDIYGNAEELILEPFRLNALGRWHGQTGGIVTRGGSVLSTSDQIYSAQRTEYPPFNTTTAQPLSLPTFGVRFVLATHVAVSDSRVREIRDRWITLSKSTGGTPNNSGDPLSQLVDMATSEIDPRRKTALDDLQLDFQLAQERVDASLEQSARSTLLAGAVLVEILNTNAESVSNKASNIRMLVELQRSAQGTNQGSEQVGSQLREHARQLTEMRNLQETYLLSLRSALDVLSSEIDPKVREAVYLVLRNDLRESGQSQVLLMLDRFWQDLSAYVEQPELASPELLQIVLN